MKHAAIIFAVSALSGCSTFGSLFPGFSGIAGSKSELTCKAPDGVVCSSVSGNYANSVADNLPGQQPSKASGHEPGLKASDSVDKTGLMVTPGQESQQQPFFSPRDLAAPNSGDPVRMAPLTLRVWFAPWEDQDGDLHDQHYVYTVVHSGKWLIESNRESIANKYRPVYPLKGNAPAKDETGKEPEIAEGFGASPIRPAQGAGE